MDPTKWAQKILEINIVSKCLEVLPPVEDGVVFVAWRLARGAAPIELQHWRGCEQNAQVRQLLDLTRALVCEDQRLRIQVLPKNLIPEIPLARTSKLIFQDTNMTRIGTASDMQVCGKTLCL